MRFFDPTLVAYTDAEPRPEPVRPVWIRPEDVLPSLVAIDRVLVHTDAVAIGLSGLWCYPNGFEFGVEVVLREPDRRGRLMEYRHHMIEPGEQIPPEMLRIGLQFSDGAKVTNLPGQSHPRGRAQPDGPILFPGGRGGGTRRQSHQFWVWPLPPPGPITFVCEWPHFQIDETKATIDAPGNNRRRLPRSRTLAHGINGHRPPRVPRARFRGCGGPRRCPQSGAAPACRIAVDAVARETGAVLIRWCWRNTARTVTRAPHHTPGARHTSDLLTYSYWCSISFGHGRQGRTL